VIMDFSLSSLAEETCRNMWDFMNEEVLPAEPAWREYLREHGEHTHPPIMEDLKASAKRRGLWNLFMPAWSGMSTPPWPRFQAGHP